MMLWLAAACLVAGAWCLKIDRQTAAYLREHLHTPPLQFAWRITNWAKGLPWIIASFVLYAGVEAAIAVYGTTPLLRQTADYALALLLSFAAASVVLHGIKIFLGRRRPRDDYEHGLYGFRYFTWELQYDSFPSGHAMTIFCVAVVLCAIVPALSALWLLLAGGLASTRVLMTAHFASDVLVGAAVGILVTREMMLTVFPGLTPGWF